MPLKSDALLENAHRTRYFVLGSLFAVTAIAMAFLAFQKGNLSDDQRQLLRWLLPIAAGFSAGAFTGAITLKSKVLLPATIGATGGFTVWLLSTYILFPTQKPSAEDFDATIYLVDEIGRPIEANGSLTIPLNLLSRWNIDRGQSLPRDIPAKWRDKKVKIFCSVDGYTQSDVNITHQLSPGAIVNITMKKDSARQAAVAVAAALPAAPPPPLIQNSNSDTDSFVEWPRMAVAADISAIEKILTAGAPVDKTTESGYTALHFAARSGRTDIVKLLIARGLSIDAKTDDRTTPLFLAVQAGHIEIVRFLIQKGASIDQAAITGSGLFSISLTPIITVAIREGNMEITKLLIEKGANLNPIGSSGFMSSESVVRPLQAALSLKGKQIAFLLLQHGAKPRSGDLIRAVYSGDEKLVVSVLEKGGDLNDSDSEGTKVVAIAQKSENPLIRELLSKWEASHPEGVAP